MTAYDLVIIGGGPAGLAAAVAAYDRGVKNIIILEREPRLGGILNQCIHNGFGLHTFKEELTGPEYAERYEKMVLERKIEYSLDTTALSVGEDKTVTAVSAQKGLMKLQSKAIILACGCRERPRGGVNIAGSRASGIFSAGTAQKLINIEGKKIGNRVVILGSGDIGLIMARRMTFEGARVEAVLELMPYSSGLKRNIAQCLEDFEIPLRFSHTVVEILGEGRITGVKVAKVNEKLEPMLETAETILCDTLLLSVGLIPENELAKSASAALSPVTGGAMVDSRLMTDKDGIFECGNMLHVHDLVDYVSEESGLAGRSAAEYILGGKRGGEGVKVKVSGGVRYTVPQIVLKTFDGEGLTFRMRVDNVYKKVAINLLCDGKSVMTSNKQIVLPGEMETLTVRGAALEALKKADQIEISLIRR